MSVTALQVVQNTMLKAAKAAVFQTAAVSSPRIQSVVWGKSDSGL